ncbi:WD40-repeat-containing domain protein [Absidia repens]|uniref:WD40-repeat-containing domain protein n=1 Tax=Absidia repens TaxID=90262 RepID=A0A1X2IAS7_9FUNG|nr:WD40-repeat-containing domain protein [Absidia repens]
MDDSFEAHLPQKQHQPTLSLTPDYSTQPDFPLTCQDLVEHIPNLTELDNEQKADLAFMLLQDIPEPYRDTVIRRLRMNRQSRNRLEVLPQELIIDILCHLNVTSLLEVSLLSRHWYALCQDAVIWRYMFEGQNWEYNAIGMERYLAKDSSAHYTIPSKQLIPASPLLLQSTPIVRSSAPLYQRRQPANNINSSSTPTSTSTSTINNILSPSLLTRISSNSASSSLNNPFSVLKPFQTAAAAASSTSAAATPLPKPPKPRKPLLSQKVASSKPRSVIPPHPGHQHLLPHYDVKTHTRFIDWKSLYRQRHKIASSWRLGKYQPYRFRSDPASLRRQQQEESGNNSNRNSHVDGDTTTDQDIAMPEIQSSYLSNIAVPSSSSSSELSATASEVSPESTTSTSSQQYQPQPGPQGEQQPQQIIGQLEQMEQRRQQQQQRDQHQDAVYSLALDDAHHTIFSASRDETVKEWHFNDAVATLQHTYTDLHQGSILCLDVDDRYIVSGSKDRAVVQTDRRQRKKLRVLHGHQGSVLNVVLDTAWIYSASKDRTINIWSSATGELLRTLHGHREAVNAIKVHEDRIVSASGDHTIKLWHRDTGECLRTFMGHERAISCLDFDGTYIVSGSKDKSIIVWDLEGNIVRKIFAHTELVRTLQLQQPHRQQQPLVSAHTNDGEHNNNHRLSSDALMVDDAYRHPLKMEPSSTSTSRVIVSAGYNDTVNVWNFETGQLLHAFPRFYPGRIINLRFDNMKIVLGLDSGDIVVYDFAFGLDSRFLL